MKCIFHRSIIMISIKTTKNGSLLIETYDQDFNQQFNQFNDKLEDAIEMSVGPRDHFDGIRSCLTYTPPEGSKPGYQASRSVSVMEMYEIKSLECELSHCS